MSTVGYATLDVIPSVKGLRSAIEKQTSGDLAAAGKKSGQRFGDAAGVEAATGFKGRFSNAMRGFNPLAGLAIGAGVVGLFKSAISEASEAEQAVGGVRAVFGEYADQVEGDSRRAAEALGLSSTAYQQLITVSGAMLKNKGLTDFADQATNLVETGADLAAMFGGTTKDAVDALNAAMRGESDPIERYGISLNETAVNAELAKSGMEGLEGAALEQAKTQARLSLITQQSADAQGAFGRESNTLAGQQQRLTAEWQNMTRELGENLLPAATAFVSFARNDMLPALETAGGLAKDAVSAFGDLPGPVKAAAGAFVALRIAAATGFTTKVTSGVSRLSGVMDSMRLRTMLAADAFRSARGATVGLSQPILGARTGMGRLGASMQGVRVAAQGLGGALKTGLGGVMGLVGGPWGAALIGGTALLGKFWSEHQEAKAHADELTASLNQQTGAITENTRATVLDKLEKEGLLAEAERLGVSLGDVTNAALGNKDAVAALKGAHAEAAAEVSRLHEAGRENISTEVARRNSLGKLIDAVDGESAAIRRGREATRLKAEADRDAKGATDALRDAAEVYGTAIDKLRGKLEKLMDREQQRALRAIQQRRDAIALRETFRAANEEAENGRRVLFNNTKAADANMSALLDLGEQWTNSKDKVKNAEGAYEDMRQKFIKVAEKMGATREQARKLADEILDVPKTAPVRFQSEGYKERMAEIKALEEAMKRLGSASLDYTPRGFGSPDGFATGGMIGGVGSGTSDSNLIYASKGEFMQPKATVDYYGAGFMEALRKRLIPRVPGYAQGGPITRTAAAPSAGVQVSIGQVVAHDYRDFTQQVQRKAQKASLGGFGA